MKYIVFLFILFNGLVFSNEVTYEKRQVIDLGALSIEGELIAPGDLSITDDEKQESKFLYKRKNYNDRLNINIEYVF